MLFISEIFMFVSFLKFVIYYDLNNVNSKIIESNTTILLIILNVIVLTTPDKKQRLSDQLRCQTQLCAIYKNLTLNIKKQIELK